MYLIFIVTVIQWLHKCGWVQGLLNIWSQHGGIVCVLFPTLIMSCGSWSLNEVLGLIINQASFLSDHLELLVLVKLLETITMSHKLLLKLLLGMYLDIISHPLSLDAERHHNFIISLRLDRCLSPLKLYDWWSLLLMRVKHWVMTVFLRCMVMRLTFQTRSLHLGKHDRAIFAKAAWLSHSTWPPRLLWNNKVVIII